MMKCPTCGVRYSASERICPKDGAVLEPVQTREQQLLGTTLDGKYRLDSFISRGGMGAVFRGTHVMLDRPVAVKMIKADLVSSPEIVRRFQREARAATQLNHPNIVHVYDLGQTSDGTLYIAMELVAGKSLKEAIKSDGAFDADRIVRVLGQVCDGLAVAHRAGVVHRDLKPQNIMLTRDRNGAELAKIVDFGIAKTFEIDAKTQITAEGATLGTPQYMSPEQAAGTEIDGRSDVYSLGVILYEMLTGEVPFNADSVPAILVKHMNETPTPPSQRRPDLEIAPALEAVALRALAKYPAARFESVDEMGSALRMASSVGIGDSVTVRPAAAVPIGETVPSSRTATPPLPSAIPPVPAATVTPGTHPTAPVPAGPPPLASVASVTPATRSSRGPIAVVALLFVLLATLVGLGYWNWSRSREATETVTADDATAPQTSPAAGSTPTTIPEDSRAASAGTTPDPSTSTRASDAVTSAPDSKPSLSAAGRPEATAAVPATPGTAATARAEGRSAVPSGQTSGTATTAVGKSNARSTATANAVAGGPPAPSGERVPGSSGATAPEAAQRPSAGPALPENPTVSFQCRGAGEVCGPLRNAMQEAVDSAGLRLARTGADVVLTAEVTILEEREDRQFDSTMVVRTYSIELEGDSPRLNEMVPMPTSRTFSADARLGAERFNENARLTAAAAVERIRAFWKKRTP